MKASSYKTLNNGTKEGFLKRKLACLMRNENVFTQDARKERSDEVFKVYLSFSNSWYER